MPFIRPNPNAKPRSKVSSGVEAVVQAEKLMQMALMLPSAVVIGWVIGAWGDSRLHQSWMAIAGIVLGAVSGLTYVIRMAVQAEKNMRPDGKAASGKENGSPDIHP